MRTKHYLITNELAVDGRFDKVLATANNDEQQRPDWSVYLHVAPEIGGSDEPSAIVYMGTNGDPVYIGAMAEDGWHHMTEEDCEGTPCGISCLEEFGFLGETEKEAFDFVADLMAAAGMNVL